MLRLLTRVSVFSLTALIFCQVSLHAQVVQAPLNDGFVRTSSIEVTIDEMLGIAQARDADAPLLGPGFPSLWIAEVQIKPLRLLRVNWKEDGANRQEIVRYLMYRVILRDYTDLAGPEKPELEAKLADIENRPVNNRAEELTRPLRLPKFLLQAEELDGTVVAAWPDVIHRGIQQAIFERELGRRGVEAKLLNSVEALQEIGEPVAADDPDTLDRALYGVAIWRNVDDRADFFTVYMSGFSNAYRITQDDEGNNVFEEKVIVQKFARPGDEFLQEEMEFRLIDTADLDGDEQPEMLPAWIYRRRAFDASITDFNQILRRIPTSSIPGETTVAQ